ncbi:type II secretion system F family protein [Cryobacterium sp. TMT1-66-1]|uniref:type II secretion system F family protein n=1 Tax=Cryobacterium sp. TMT1-66-1 TaxID=1259242 RepID=UPI00106CF970|nr:type II secretion system F family protein [Cryobacterium sp. TMT1-66-1]TFD09290.1 type II secretion system F family protein [Cryobacterium sp. TMT1-66-1]
MPPILIFFAALAVASGLAAIVAILVGARRTDPVADAVLVLPGLGRPGRLPRRSGLLAASRELAPKGYVGFLDHRLALAGRPAAWTTDKIFIAKPALAGAGLLLAVLWITNDPVPLRILVGSLLVVICFFVPDLLLYSRGQERQAAMQNALADTLDQMTISVEAGLGFEAAMSKAGTNGSGPLAEELIRTLQDMSIGRSRKDAYLALADRTDSADLRRFTRSVIQADTYGIAIADVLRVQAGEMRLRRRQRAEEQAMKVPVKVIFPLVFCILPVLFIVLLTPAVINIMKVFSL